MWTVVQRPCGLGKLFAVLTSPSSENILTKYRHPLKIAFLSILSTNEDNSEEILGKTVECFPSPPTLPLTHLAMSQAQNWLTASLCSAWIDHGWRAWALGSIFLGLRPCSATYWLLDFWDIKLLVCHLHCMFTNSKHPPRWSKYFTIWWEVFNKG